MMPLPLQSPTKCQNDAGREDRGPRARLKVLVHQLPITPIAVASPSFEVLKPVGTDRLSRIHRNWGGNVLYQAKRVATPASVEQLKELVRTTVGPIRAIGRGHSFSPLCENVGGTLVALRRMNNVLHYEPPSASQRGSVTIESGVTYAELISDLAQRSPPGALPNLHGPMMVTVAGAVATGSHGSGLYDKGLASHVTSIELVIGDGSIVEYNRSSASTAEMHAAVMNLGCLGVVSRLTLEVVPWFECRNVCISMTIDQMLSKWEDLVAIDGRPPLCDSFSVHPSWSHGVCMVVLRNFLPHSPRYPGRVFRIGKWNVHAVREQSLDATLARVGVTLVELNVLTVTPGSMAAEVDIASGWVLESISSLGTAGAVVGHSSGIASAFAAATSSTITLCFRDPAVGNEELQQLQSFGLPHASVSEGPWHDMLPLWMKNGKVTYVGPAEESEFGQQAEYFVPLDRAKEAIEAANAVLQRWSPSDPNNLRESGILSVGELRIVAAQAGWLCPNQTDSLTIDVNLNGHPDRGTDVLQALDELERVLAPIGARPHWGKLYSLHRFHPARLYGDGLHRFREFAERHDPAGKFRSKWIHDALFSD